MQSKRALLLVVAIFSSLGCASATAHELGRDLLFAWASDVGREDSDFLAVVDLATNQVIRTVPVGQSGTMAHHTDYEMPRDGTLLANDFYANRTWLFDLSNPQAPKIRWTVADTGTLSFAHSFARLPNGNIVATFQRGDHADRSPGGIAEFTIEGRLLRWSSAADPHANEYVRPYSLAIVSKLDRIVTTTADMGATMPAMPNMPNMPNMPAMRTKPAAKSPASRTVQLWRLSDLKLLQTLVLPAGPSGTEQFNPNEPRVLADGRTVMVGTGNCGLYRLHNLDSARATAEFVHGLGQKSCAVPVVAGHFWIVAVGSLPGLVAIDISDPSHAREASRLVLDADAMPHWLSLAPDGRRIAITGFKSMRSKILLATVDPLSGKLALTGSIDFAGKSWPHGSTSAAMPHGVVFARSR
jgi:hypothetical protein